MSEHRSVADDLRDEQLRDMQKLTAEERIELALRLGRRDLELYMAANNVDREPAGLQRAVRMLPLAPLSGERVVRRTG